jgi:hypothetical protein
MPLRYGAVRDQFARIVGRELLDQFVGLVEHAGHVGEQKEPLGLERAGNCAGKGVH